MGRAGPRRLMALGRHGALTPDGARARRSRRWTGPDTGAVAANLAMPLAQLVALFINQHAKPKRKAQTAASYAGMLK